MGWSVRSAVAQAQGDDEEGERGGGDSRARCRARERPLAPLPHGQRVRGCPRRGSPERRRG